MHLGKIARLYTTMVYWIPLIGSVGIVTIVAVNRHTKTYGPAPSARMNTQGVLV
jgi:hypothetical protein